MREGRFLPVGQQLHCLAQLEQRSISVNSGTLHQLVEVGGVGVRGAHRGLANSSICIIALSAFLVL